MNVNPPAVCKRHLVFEVQVSGWTVSWRRGVSAHPELVYLRMLLQHMTNGGVPRLFKPQYHPNIYVIVFQGDFGDVSDRKALRDSLHCHDFRWYLNNIFPELFVPSDSIASGEVIRQFAFRYC